jgi:hypothetical protein
MMLKSLFPCSRAPAFQVFVRKVAVLAFVLCVFSGIAACASGKVEPVSSPPTIERVDLAVDEEDRVAASPNQVKITINWNGGVPQGYRYAIFRAKTVEGREENSDKTYEFLKELPSPPSEASKPFVYSDDAIEPGFVYYYHIFGTKGDFHKKTGGKPDPLLEHEGKMISGIDPPKTTPVKISIQTKEAPAGVYVGIISFAGNALNVTLSSMGGKDPGGLVFLDTATSANALIGLLNGNYAGAEGNGNALYYAAHKAIMNVHDNINAGKIPNKLDAVHIIAITDGLDNSSANPILGDDVKSVNPKDDWGRLLPALRQKNGYPSFLKDLADKGIDAGKPTRPIPLHLSKYHLRRGDLPDAAFDAKGGIDRLRDDMVVISHGLNTSTQNSTVTAVMPFLYDGVAVRINLRPDDPKTFIQGKIQIRDKTPYFTDIYTEPATLLLNGATEARSVQEGKNSFVYNFVLSGRWFPDVSENQASVYVGESGVADNASFIHIHPDNPAFDRRSIVVYFLLDSGKYLSDEIPEIKRAVGKAIAALFDVVSKNNDDNGTYEEAGVAEPGIEPLPMEKKYGADDLKKLLADEAARLWIPKLSTSDDSISGTLGFWVQVGAYNSLNAASETLMILIDNGIMNALIEPTADAKGTYKVRMGPFPTRAGAFAAIESLRGN